MIKNINRLIKYMGENRTKYFIIIFITLIIEGFCVISFSLLNKTIFNAIEYSDFDMFKFGLKIAVLYIIAMLMTHLFRYLSITETRNIVFRIKNEMFEKLTSLDMDYFNQNHSGSVIQKLGFSANALKDLYFSNGYWVIKDLFTGVLSTYLMFRLSPKLSIASIIISLIALYISIKLTKRVYEKNRALYGNLTKLTEYLVDILSGFVIIKIYDNNNFIRQKYFNENNGAYDKTVELSKYDAFKNSVIFLVSMVSKFGIIFFGISLVLKGEMDYGTLMASIALQESVSYCILVSSHTISMFSSQIAYTEKVFDFLEMDIPSDYEKEDLQLDLSKGIELLDVTFAYKDRDTVLDNFNIEIKPNEKVMICGHSGGGKSTILKLLLGFYGDYTGEIKIFGNNIKDYPISQLRSLITYVPQTSFLFDDTVKENIKYGNVSATDDEIKEASDNAFATEFIEYMIDGFDTVVEKGGGNMSGGQKQRISIARAFIRNSPILLMDEPTSSLDSKSEKEINLAMKNLMKDKIVIMVTHKRNAEENFDRVIEM